MFYRHHTVPVTSCSQAKYVLKRASFGRKDCTKELKLESAYFLVLYQFQRNECFDHNKGNYHLNVLFTLQLTITVCLCGQLSYWSQKLRRLEIKIQPAPCSVVDWIIKSRDSKCL